MIRLLNSIKQSIKKYYRAYMFILFAFNAFRTTCVYYFNPLETFVIKLPSSP